MRHPHLNLMSLVAAIAVTASLLLVPSTASAKPATHQGVAARRYNASAFGATNQHRVAHGRGALHHQACVQGFALRWARRMARTHEFKHQSLGPIMRRCGLSWSGENIAYGYGNGAATVNQGWMHSAGHRANILRPQFRLMGIAAVRDAHGTWWVSQVFGRR